jgi:hypothetical protein
LKTLIYRQGFLFTFAKTMKWINCIDHFAI